MNNTTSQLANNVLYLLNTPVLTNYGTFKFEPIGLKEIKTLLEQTQFISAIGHQGAADFLSILFEREIPMNRISVQMQQGDQAIVLRLKSRMLEGMILQKEDMDRLEFEFGILTHLS